jgi:hypothetical protein
MIPITAHACRPTEADLAADVAAVETGIAEWLRNELP